MNLGDNIRILLERVANACASAGRSSNEITVVAATKCVPAEIVNTLPEFGIKIAGENRVQEFLQKCGENSPLVWHIIGGLQTNKVKYVVGKVALVQSVDRMTLAHEINKLSGKRNVVTEVLIEVNAGNEENKSGIPPEQALDLAAEISELTNLKLRGLMSVPPKGADAKIYEKMKNLSDNVKSKYAYADILSVGMSEDYEIAIKCGSNMIRPGRALFGADYR